MSTTPKSSVTRRSVVKGAAWAVPAVTVAGVAPAMAASMPCTPDKAKIGSDTSVEMSAPARWFSEPNIVVSPVYDGWWTVQNTGGSPIPAGFTWEAWLTSDMYTGGTSVLELPDAAQLAPVLKFDNDDISLSIVKAPCYTDIVRSNSNNLRSPITEMTIDWVVRFTFTNELKPGASVKISLNRPETADGVVVSQPGSTRVEQFLGKSPSTTIKNTAVGTSSQQILVVDAENCTGVLVQSNLPLNAAIPVDRNCRCGRLETSEVVVEAPRDVQLSLGAGDDPDTSVLPQPLTAQISDSVGSDTIPAGFWWVIRLTTTLFPEKLETQFTDDLAKAVSAKLESTTDGVQIGELTLWPTQISEEDGYVRVVIDQEVTVLSAVSSVALEVIPGDFDALGDVNMSESNVMWNSLEPAEPLEVVDEGDACTATVYVLRTTPIRA